MDKYKTWFQDGYYLECLHSLVLISLLWFKMFIPDLCKFPVLRILQVYLALSNVNVEEYKTVV